MIAPVSAIIATKDRPVVLQRTMESVFNQSCLPYEIIVVDGSANDSTKEILHQLPDRAGVRIMYGKASTHGAASQRIRGLEMASQPAIWFLDDDIILEAECTERIWKGFDSMPNVGAVNAMITNQRYTSPGFLTRSMYRLMHGKKLPSYAGKIIGPAWNLLPEDEPGLPEYTVCEWLNTTCTMYKREALPDPVFSPFFTGYSLMEDVALSVTIGKNHTLLNARTARIYHDSQPGDHKNNVADLARMELVNRYYVMTRILGRKGFVYSLKLGILQWFGLLTSLRNSSGRRNFFAALGGKISGMWFLMGTGL